MKPYWIAGIVFGIIFTSLMAVRLNLLHLQSPSPPVGLIALSERDTWMNLFQEGQKIGFSHSVLKRDEVGYRLEQSVHMRLNIMGMVQDVVIVTDSRLNPDLSLDSFDFSMDSGRFLFKAKGMVSKGMLIADLEGTGGEQRMEIPLPRAPHLASVLYDAVIAGGMKPGESRTFEIFDIASLAQVPVSVQMKGKEKIQIMGAIRDVSRIVVQYKGMVQSAWISEEGEVLREEGLLGMRLEKTDSHSAIAGIVSRPGHDLTLSASVQVATPIQDPKTRTRIALKIEGISIEGLELHGGRQALSGNTLVVEKEPLSDLQDEPLDPQKAAPYLKAAPFIQSDHERIVSQSRQITASKTHPLDKVRELVVWMQDNIEKKPAISIPDALSVLENRSGDCNEHAILFAALARAAGIPARVEAGLVYLKGRFYYHAWNLAYVGRWITVDALFNEIPADVTHIRLVNDAERNQLDLLPVIGRIKISVVDDEAARKKREAF